MITGFNTDIKHHEKVYHVQTEDKGKGNPCIESLVYVGGEILASKKTSYAEQVENGIDEKAIGQLMEQQHRTMIAAIKRGRFDSLSDTQSRAPIPRSTLAADPLQSQHPEEKTLDQVILDYLASEAESEHLELSLLDQVDFVSGQPFEIRLAARKSLSQQPITGVRVEVRVISTIQPPQVIFRGSTDPSGSVVVRCTMPNFQEGTAAVILSAQSDLGNDEIKQLVKRKK